jgi:hypothetical protein
MTENTRLNVNVEPALLDAFKKVAQAAERSVGGHVRWLMRQAVEQAKETGQVSA